MYVESKFNFKLIEILNFTHTKLRLPEVKFLNKILILYFFDILHTSFEKFGNYIRIGLDKI